MHAICENATVMRSSGIYTIVYPSETFSNHLSLPDADKMHCLLLLAYVQKKRLKNSYSLYMVSSQPARRSLHDEVAETESKSYNTDIESTHLVFWLHGCALGDFSRCWGGGACLGW